MKETSILFTPDNIRAILDRRKHQTRRVLNGERYKYGIAGDRLYIKEGAWVWCDAVPNGTTGTERPKVHYVPVGNHVVYCLGNKKPTERIDDTPRHCWHHRTAMFMPKKDARTWLELTDVRVERLQDISAEDALAEGITHSTMNDPRVEYQWLWDSINAKTHPWSNNDWVWVLTFKAIPREVTA